jgi:hypothetical protein
MTTHKAWERRHPNPITTTSYTSSVSHTLINSLKEPTVMLQAGRKVV